MSEALHNAVQTLPPVLGAGASILGNMVGLSGFEWTVLEIAIATSVASGAMARIGLIEMQNGRNSDIVKLHRRLQVMMIAAQVALGNVAAAQAGGNIWITIGACVAIGWAGPSAFNWLARGFKGDGK